MGKEADGKAIARILKVNHAGEHGAIRIYRAQLAAARIRYPELQTFLKKTLDDEVSHCVIFREAMRPRRTRPCYSLWFWSWGGYVLGFVTAMMGRNAVMLCTEAVEDAVHHHMNEQIAFLNGRDDELRQMIENIRIEELEHLHYAQERVKHAGFTRRAFKMIYAVTEILIWLSTQGGLTRMKRDIS